MDLLSGAAFKLKFEPPKATNNYLWSNEMEILLRGKVIWKCVDLAKGQEVIRGEESTSQKSDLALTCLVIFKNRSFKSSVMRLRNLRDV